MQGVSVHQEMVRVLVGYEDGSVRMWELDLENLAINQADTTDTRDDSDERRVIRISPSGKTAVTISRQSSDVGFLDTTTGNVALTDIKASELNTDIAFSPNEDQVAFIEESLTICDIMHPEKRISFDPWPGKDVWERKVAFQTCNDLVVRAFFHGGSGSLQVWHRQDPTGFECMYSLDINIKDPCPFLAPDGLTVVIVPESSFPTFYSWNHDIAQFDPVHFDDQVHISWKSSPEYSADGKLFACWSDKDSHVRVWDTRTGHLVSMFPTSEVNAIALSPALIGHSLGKRLISLESKHENAIGLFDAYTGHLHAQILGQAYGYMAFIRDGTALAYYYYYNSGVRIWEIADLTAEHRHSTHGYELRLQGMEDGWMMDQDDEPLFWVPVENRQCLYVPPPRVLIEGPDISTSLDFSNSRFGTKWTECVDKGWLKELDQKEKEVGKLLE